MRLRRVSLILLGIYFTFIGGSAYYSLVFPIRVFHHLLVTALLALWLIGRIRSKRGLPQTPLNLPVYALTALWIVSAAASLDPRMAFEHLWFQLIHVLIFFIFVDWLQRGRQRLLMETVFMLAAGVIFLSGLELASWYFGLGFLPGTQIGWVDVIGPGAWLPLQPPRLSLAMNISTLLAGYVAPLVIITTAWALTAHPHYRFILRLIALALALILLLTFSRGGLLSVAAASLTWVVLRLTQTEPFTRRVPIHLFVSLAAGIGLIGLVGFLLLSLSSNRSFGDAGRVDMWRGAVAMTRDHPLTGVGPGMFGRAFRDYRDPALVQDKLASAHNLYLNTAAEIGLPGLIVSLWLGIALIRAWRRNWQAAASSARRLRLEAAGAALVGLGVHSLVDVFTITPIVLLILFLAACCVTPLPASSVLTAPPPRRLRFFPDRALAVGALVAVLAYGLWFIQLDRAQSHYLNSLRTASLPEAEAAAALDPGLKLYSLQIAHLYGQTVLTNPAAPLQPAVEQYRRALALEPGWDTGWINLAALELRQGNSAAALAALDRARRISQDNSAALHWAQLAEQTGAAPADEIAAAYQIAMLWNGNLPLSAFWWETPTRRAALEQSLPDLPLDWQYRVLAVYDPQRASALVTTAPAAAPAAWVAGEYALTVEQDAAKATRLFSEAIRLAPATGDYYAARARAELRDDPSAASRDLDIAQLLGTIAEYPNAIRAELAGTPEQTEQLRANALPPTVIGQEFAAVLFARVADFDVFPEMRRVGPGRAAMQPWYTIAADRLAAGSLEGARSAYRAILDYAPDETEAAEQLDRLKGAFQVIETSTY